MKWLLWLDRGLTAVLVGLAVGIFLAVFASLFTGCALDEEPEGWEESESAVLGIGPGSLVLFEYNGVTLPEVVTTSGAYFTGSYRVQEGAKAANKPGQVVYVAYPPSVKGAVWVRGFNGWAWVQGGPPWNEILTDVSAISGVYRMAPILCEPPKPLDSGDVSQ